MNAHTLLLQSRNDSPLIPLIIAVFLIGVIVYSLWFMKRRVHKTWDRFIQLGQTFGITVVKPQIGTFLPKLAALDGTHRNLRLSVWTERRGSGKQTVFYTVAEVHCNTHKGFQLRLVKEGLFQKIGKALGMQDIQTGNEEFDKKYVLKSPQPELALKLFDYQLCNYFVEQHPSFFAAFDLGNGVIRYEEQVLVDSDIRLERFMKIVQTQFLLAEKIQEIN